MTTHRTTHRTIYAIPEYVVSKHIPEEFVKHLPKINWADAYGYATNRPSVDELAKLQDIKVFDTALPKDLVAEFRDLTGFNPVGHFVYCYDEEVFGSLKPITREGIVALDIYYHLITGD